MASVTSLPETATRSHGHCPPKAAVYLQISAEKTQGQLVVSGVQVFGECQCFSRWGARTGQADLRLSVDLTARALVPGSGWGPAHTGEEGWKCWPAKLFESYFTISCFGYWDARFGVQAPRRHTDLGHPDQASMQAPLPAG